MVEFRLMSLEADLLHSGLQITGTRISCLTFSFLKVLVSMPPKTRMQAIIPKLKCRRSLMLISVSISLNNLHFLSPIQNHRMGNTERVKKVLKQK